MTKEERIDEIRIVRSHLEGVMSDLTTTEYKLLDLKCAKIAHKLNSVCAALYNVIWDLSEKEDELR